MNKAEQLIACLEGEIAKRDARIVELESGQSADMFLTLTGEITQLRAELSAAKETISRYETTAENCDLLRAELAAIEAQEPVAAVRHGPLDSDGWPEFVRVETIGDFDLENLPSGMKLYAAPVSEAKAQGVVMPEHETSTPSSKWASAGESDPHGKAYDCERAELSMGEYTDDELANAVFMHDHRSFDIAATMRGEPGSIVLLTAAKDRIRWLSRSLDKALARLNAAPVQQVSVPECFTKLLHHAHGMTLGADWNKGTMASYHREPLGEAVVQCQAWLAAAPAAPAADAWIPVSERLPGEDDQVLCWCEDETVAWAEVSSHHNSFFTDMTHELLPVTHWMPLPAAPIKIEANRHDQ